VSRPRPDFVIRDPLWGDIYLFDEERRVVDADLFQRQRGVKQLGTSMFVYPSAVQTRFVHALGNLQIIDRMFRAAMGSCREVGLFEAFLIDCGEWLGMATATAEERDLVFDRVRVVIRIAGMCHDLGHLPMGHVVEVAISEAAGLLDQVLGSEHSSYVAIKGLPGGAALHEFFTYRLLDLSATAGSPLFANDVVLAGAVRDVIAATQPHAFNLSVSAVGVALADLVSSNIDSDRAEYLRRDGWVSGSGYGQVDLERLIDSYQLVRSKAGAYVFRPSTRALTPIVSFLIERVKAYSHLYYHNIGVLFDNLLIRVIRLAFVPHERAEVVASLRGDAKARFVAALNRLEAGDFNYRKFVGVKGYLDDARLWVYLSDLAVAADQTPPTERSTALRRLMAYLDVLLRRRHLWISLWKTAEDMKPISETSFDAFVHALDARRGTPVSLDAYRRWLGRFMREKTKFDVRDDELLFLNFVPTAYAGHLDRIAMELESLLGDGHFVEIGHRARFQPIKDPDKYEIVNRQNQLARLIDIAPASVRAVQALWYETALLRVFVLTADEPRDEGLQERLTERAQQLLPLAIQRWVEHNSEVNFDPETGFAGTA
jgi:HD superfamily phosphohydrolase